MFQDKKGKKKKSKQRKPQRKGRPLQRAASSPIRQNIGLGEEGSGIRETETRVESHSFYAWRKATSRTGDGCRWGNERTWAQTPVLNMWVAGGESLTTTSPFSSSAKWTPYKFQFGCNWVKITSFLVFWRYTEHFLAVINKKYCGWQH